MIFKQYASRDSDQGPDGLQPLHARGPPPTSTFTPNTLKRWVKAGLCEATKTPKGYYRFRREDLDRAVGEERAS